MKLELKLNNGIMKTYHIMLGEKTLAIFSTFQGSNGKILGTTLSNVIDDLVTRREIEQFLDSQFVS